MLVLMEVGGSLQTSLKGIDFHQCFTSELKYLVETLKLFLFKLVYRAKPPTSIILEPAENCSLSLVLVRCEQ